MEENGISILLIEDDPLIQKTSKSLLSRYGKIKVCSTFAEATQEMRTCSFDIAFFDLDLLVKLDGFEFIKKAKVAGVYPIVVSGRPGNELLEMAIGHGAQDYLAKPLSDENIKEVAERFLNQRKHLIFESIIRESFITNSQAQMAEIYKIKNLSISEKPVFLQGETGTGKRVLAHIIKNIMGNKTFLELNCSQYSDEFIASELFGHVKGAFTGASSDKEGLLLKADGGIIFLDEIHALSIRAQKTLLKAIEEKEFYPVGATTPVKSNFRLITATCKDIQLLIESGKFRQDLFARISTFQIKLLPLRERKEDIELFLEHFISKHLVQVFINDEARSILRNYQWPGNTREIEDLIENWIVEGHRLITPKILPSHIKNNTPALERFVPELYLDMAEGYGLNEFMAYLKKEIVTELVKRNNDSIRETASKVGASYSNLAAFLRQNKDMDLCKGKIV